MPNHAKYRCRAAQHPNCGANRHTRFAARFFIPVILAALIWAAAGRGAALHAQNIDLTVGDHAGDVPVFALDYPDDEFCAVPGQAGLCGVPPADIAEFDANFIYRFLAYDAQRPFDRFSWQSLVALVWPQDGQGRPLPRMDGRAVLASDNSGFLARWERFPTKEQLLGSASPAMKSCAAGLAPGQLLLSGYRQSSGDILIDQDGNFILYETRLGPVAVDYIRRNGLDHADGRNEFARSGQMIDFPRTSSFDARSLSPDMSPEGDGPQRPAGVGGGEMPEFGPGAQLVKFAWRILPNSPASTTALASPASPDFSDATGLNGHRWHRYYTRSARIALGPADTIDGQLHCLDVTVGLVGLHLVQRVKSGNGDRWVWSSFEHADNAPLASNARRPNSIIGDDLFPRGCMAPDAAALAREDMMEQGGANRGRIDAAPQADALSSLPDNSVDGKAVLPSRRYAFFNPAHYRLDGASGQAGAIGALPANQPFMEDVKWAARPPYARFASGAPAVPPDIVRCWRLFSGTAETNFVWQHRLAGTVWQNYFLLGTQWVGNRGGAPFGVGEVPRYLTNVTLESFIQHQADGSCLSCHANATSDAGQASNFTFVLDPSP